MSASRFGWVTFMGIALAGVIEGMACDLDLPDVIVAPNDASPVTSDATVTSDAPVSSCASPESGWDIVFVTDRDHACSGDTITRDLVTSPSTGSATCACGSCTITPDPGCSSGSFAIKYGNDYNTARCDMTGMARDGNNGACTPANPTLAPQVQVVPPKPSSPPACTASALASGSPSATPLRACVPTESNCTPPSADFAACLQRAGDVSCPSSHPKKTLAGARANVKCGSCSCTVASHGCSGTARYYSDTNCGTQVGTATTTCALSGGNANTPTGSYKWEGQTTGTCTFGTSKAEALLEEVETLCCE
jgi:hypothetical protein